MSTLTLRITLPLAIAAAIFRLASAADEGAALPNVVIILADDLGWGSVGCYGADRSMVQTPNIDRLAREGRRFTDANTPSSVCTPTRYGMLTGRYCWRTSLQYDTLVPEAPLHIETDRFNLAGMLKSRGYRTAAVGKWHLGYGIERADFTAALLPGPLQLGFDYFAVPQNHGDFVNVFVENDRVYGLRSPNLRPPTGKNPNGKPFLGIDAPQRDDESTMQTLTDHAVTWIDKQTAAQPFVLYFTPVAVHSPITPSSATKGTSAIGPFGDWIHELDLSVGQILDALDRKQFADRSIVLFTSDNGGVLAPAQDREESNALTRGFKPNGSFRGGKGSA